MKHFIVSFRDSEYRESTLRSSKRSGMHVANCGCIVTTIRFLMKKTLSFLAISLVIFTTAYKPIEVPAQFKHANFQLIPNESHAIDARVYVKKVLTEWGN